MTGITTFSPADTIIQLFRDLSRKLENDNYSIFSTIGLFFQYVEQ